MSQIKASHLTSVALAGFLAFGVQQAAQAAPGYDDMQSPQMRAHHMDRRASAERRAPRRHMARSYRGERGQRYGYAEGRRDEGLLGAIGDVGAGAVGLGLGATEAAGNVAFGGPFGPQPGYAGQYVVVGDQLVPAAAYYQNPQGYAYMQRYGRPDYTGYYNGPANPVAATTGAVAGATGDVVGGALNIGTLGLFNDGNGPIQRGW